MRHWLMKCEPAAYTIDDLKRDKKTSWEGVRNYQARNFMRDRLCCSTRPMPIRQA
jgi:predicted RNA-binding protein with PUA-like domain